MKARVHTQTHKVTVRQTSALGKALTGRVQQREQITSFELQIPAASIISAGRATPEGANMKTKARAREKDSQRHTCSNPQHLYSSHMFVRTVSPSTSSLLTVHGC
jgi:hypothetical protein